jgi:hypothetical protein
MARWSRFAAIQRSSSMALIRLQPKETNGALGTISELLCSLASLAALLYPCASAAENATSKPPKSEQSGNLLWCRKLNLGAPWVRT